MINSEIWKSIEGYEKSYEISSCGRIKSKDRKIIDGRNLKGKLLKGGSYPNGYRFMNLRKNGVNKSHLIHRLVAKAFIPNPNNYPVVNHLDGDKSNNKLENLEWCTQADNLYHAVKTNQMESICKIRRKVTIKHNDKKIMFDTMKDASEFFGFTRTWLNSQIRKHGCTFKYQGYDIQVHGRGA